MKNFSVNSLNFLARRFLLIVLIILKERILPIKSQNIIHGISEERRHNFWKEGDVSVNHTRRKRASGQTLYSFSTDLTMTGGSDGTLVPGQLIDFSLSIDVPQISGDSDVDLRVEIFEMPLNNTAPNIHICGPEILSLGSDLQFSNASVSAPDASPQIIHANGNLGHVSKAIFDLGPVETVADTSDSTIQMKFSALALRHLIGNSEHAVLSGVAVKDYSTIIINKATFTANAELVQFDATANVEFSPSNLMTNEPSSLDIKLHATHPSFKMVIKVFNPNGFDALFNIGKPTIVNLGSGYACADLSDWEYKPTFSRTKNNYGKVTLLAPMLFNVDQNRNVEDDANSIDIKIPVTAMPNYAGPQTLAVGVMLDEVEVWSNIFTINIGEEEYPAPSPVQPTVSAKLITPHIYGGSAVIYELTISVDPEKTVHLLIEAKTSSDDVSAVTAELIDSGLCAILPVHQQSENGGVLLVDLGKCTNIDSSKSTDLKVNIAFHVSKDIGQSETRDVDIKISETEVTGLQFTTYDKSYDIGEVTAMGSSLGFSEYEVLPDTEIGFKIDVTIPPTVNDVSMSIEAYTNVLLSDVQFQICSISVQNIGSALPCMKSSSSSSVHNKSSSTKELEDMIKWDLGQSCPGSILGYSNSNDLSIKFIYRVPNQEFTHSKLNIIPAIGFYLNQESLFAASQNITLNTEDVLGSTTVQLSSNNYALTKTKPHIVAYVKDMDVESKDIAVLKVIVKIQPQTRGHFIYKFNTKSEGFLSTCRLRVTHIGSNIPCGKEPTGYVDKYSSARLNYIEDGSAEIDFGVLTNWGEHEINYDLYPDEDAIELLGFLRVTSPDSTTKEVRFVHEIASTQQQKLFNVKPGSLTNYTSNLNPVFEEILEVSNDTRTYSGIPKIIGLKLDVPAGFSNQITILFKNPDFETKEYGFCDVNVTKVGDNIPCLNLDSANQIESNEQDEPEGQISYSLYVQHYEYSQKMDENYILVEVTILTSSETTGDISLEALIEETQETASITLNLETPDLATLGRESDETFDVSYVETASQYTVIPSQKIWIPFTVSLPRFAQMPLILGFLSPSHYGRAILTVEDVRFKRSDVLSNICCTGPKVDAKSVYEVTNAPTTNISTFMQKDYIEINMGYVKNGHYTLRQGYELDDHSKFEIEVLIQGTDHQSAAQGSEFPISLAVKSRDIIAVTSQSILISRDGTGIDAKRSVIIYESVTDDLEAEFVSGDKIFFTGVLSHSIESRAEAHGMARLVFLMPRWLTIDTSSCSTNYSLSGECKVVSTNDDRQSNVIEFYGIYFSSYISLNFSIVVNELNVLPAGLGIMDSAIVSFVQCTMSSFSGYPDSDETPVLCGRYEHNSIKVKSPACNHRFELNECSVTASTAISEDAMPGNVLTDDETVWTPAVRSGKVWREEIIFDFQKMTRVSKVQITFSTIGYVLPNKLSFMSSTSGKYWKSVSVVEEAEAQTIATFDPAVYTRMMKIVIENQKDGQNKIGIKHVSWEGCPPDSSESMPCLADQTRVSTKAAKYRHIAFDSYNLIFYFCDINPFLMKDTICYSIIQGTKNYVELPHYIAYIHGFNPNSGRMYFKDKTGVDLSSKDGKRIELMKTGEIDNIIGDIEPAEVVPGQPTDMDPVVIGDYTADYNGVTYMGESIVQWSSCCESA